MCAVSGLLLGGMMSTAIVLLHSWSTNAWPIGSNQAGSDYAATETVKAVLVLSSLGLIPGLVGGLMAWRCVAGRQCRF